jgi:GR25 family glycosyltransferase involved in LPS biosynthesis
MKKFTVLVISLKDNERFFVLKKRLTELNINYNVVNAINGNLYNKKKLKLIYNKKKTENFIGRSLAPAEIGCAASHLKAYNYIIKKKIDQAIIMEDDCYPSSYLYQWIKNKNYIGNNQILNFFAYPHGYLKKNPYKIILKQKINIHLAKTHIFGAACYQINSYTCKKIINITKNKVTSIPDWPFLPKKHKINIYTTLPFLTIIDDQNKSYLTLQRNKILKKNKLLDSIKKGLNYRLLFIVRIFYYLSFLAYYLNKKIDKKFYYEHFFYKYLKNLENFFFNNHIDLKKIFFQEKYYPQDLKIMLKKIIKSKKYEDN